MRRRGCGQRTVQLRRQGMAKGAVRLQFQRAADGVACEFGLALHPMDAAQLRPPRTAVGPFRLERKRSLESCTAASAALEHREIGIAVRSARQ